MKNIFLTVTFFIIHFALSAQPGWIDDAFRKETYPSTKYFSNFSFGNVHEIEKSDATLKQLSIDAKSTLAQSVVVSVQANVLSKMTEKDGVISKEFVDNVLTQSMVEFPGLEQESWIDSKNKVCYFFCSIEKEKLKDFYINKYNTRIQSIKTFFELGDKANIDENTGTAIKNYQLAMAELIETGNIISIIQSIDSKFNIDEYLTLKLKARNSFAQLEKSKVTNAKSAADLLVYLLTLQIDKGTVVVFPFCYENTQLTSQLSILLKDQLINSFTNNSKIIPVIKQSDGNGLMIRGSIWEIDDQLRICCTLLDSSKATVIAAAEVYLPKEWAIKNGYEWKPSNLEDVLKNMITMQELEGISNGIRVEIFTNKGNSNLLFVEGEKMSLYVKVNHSCYLRAIYTLADGTKTLLLDNLLIDPSLVNRIYLISQEFECSPPLGVENLKVFASTEEFSPLQTNNLDGYKIINNSTTEMLSISRGFKAVKSENLKGESSITITTMKQ